jgi:hypothetical protein
VTARVLPVEEWDRLAGTSLDGLSLNPQFAEVLVVEQDGAIVGSLALLTTLHAECLRVEGVSATRALWKLLRERVKAAGGSAVWGASLAANMNRLLTRHGELIPGDHFLLRM